MTAAILVGALGIHNNTMRRRRRAHQWKKNDYSGDIDDFAYTAGKYHNGPECEVCGFGFCHHCNPEGYDTACPHSTMPADDRKLDPIALAFEAAVRGSQTPAERAGDNRPRGG